MPEQHVLEVPDKVLDVEASEISATRYLTQAEKDAIERERLAEEERARKRAEDDSGQRALMGMMGGTLKTKKDLSPLEVVLDREEWMDTVPVEDMTEAQLALMEEFKMKEKLLREEQDKYRKQLDAELKKHRADIQELIDQFDGKLKQLHHRRYHTDMQVFNQELYCIRLHLALLQHAEDLAIAQRTAKEVVEGEEAESAARVKVEALEQELRKVEKQVDEKQRKERELGASFKSVLQGMEMEGEAAAALNRLFRQRRQRPETSLCTLQAELTGDKPREGQGDPYNDEGQEEEPVPDVRPEEPPEGLDEAAFRKTLEMRRERWVLEGETFALQAQKEEIERLLKHRQGEHTVCKDKLAAISTELKDHVQVVRDEQFDIELLFFVKQGQVEVPQAAVVTDYADAVIFDKEVLECRNRRIREIAKEKVNHLHTVKDFRKRLLELDWQHKMLAHKTLDLEERTKDVHMLRVTKGLQSLLSGQGEESRASAEAQMLEKKIEHLNASMQRKEDTLRQTLGGYHRAVKLKQRENSMLEKKLRELQQNVIQREHIRRLRAPTAGAGHVMGEKGVKKKIVGGGGAIEENEGEVRAATARFRDLKLRRNMMEAAKRHTDEIDLLRQELDRLRQKTFPSFVRLHENKGGPDAQ